MVAWLLVCVSEAEQRGGRKGLCAEVLEKKRKKEVEKYITGGKKKKKKKKKVGSGRVGYPLDRVKWVPVKAGGAGL
jgi:hypothetical protein